MYIECLCVFYFKYIMHIDWYLAAVFLMFRVVLKYSNGISTTIALVLIQDSLTLAPETPRHANG